LVGYSPQNPSVISREHCGCDECCTVHIEIHLFAIEQETTGKNRDVSVIGHIKRVIFPFRNSFMPHSCLTDD
jgi:hypothetical protein